MIKVFHSYLSYRLYLLGCDHYLTEEVQDLFYTGQGLEIK